jgi:hypothetical protein
VILLLLWLAVIAGACVWLGRRMRDRTQVPALPG